MMIFVIYTHSNSKYFVTGVHYTSFYVYTVFRKNTHSHFLFYFRRKCPDFYKIFIECLGGNKHSNCKQIRCFSLPVTSYFHVCILWVLPLTTDIGEILKQTNWSLSWLNPKIC